MKVLYFHLYEAFEGGGAASNKHSCTLVFKDGTVEVFLFVIGANDYDGAIIFYRILRLMINHCPDRLIVVCSLM